MFDSVRILQKKCLFVNMLGLYWSVPCLTVGLLYLNA